MRESSVELEDQLCRFTQCRSIRGVLDNDGNELNILVRLNFLQGNKARQEIETGTTPVRPYIDNRNAAFVAGQNLGR